MTLRFSRVFREADGEADCLSNLGAMVDSFTWWDSAPLMLLLFCMRMFLGCLAICSASFSNFSLAGFLAIFLFYFNKTSSLW